MNLEQVYMFDGFLYYSPGDMFYLEPLRKFLQMDTINIEQFMAIMGEGESQPVMSLDKKSRIATIDIKGPLMPKANGLTMMLGGTSTNEINKAVQEIQQDKGIKGTLLRTNSPGGSAAGIDETAQRIHELAQKKPVLTQVTGSNGSAGYYLTSQANGIYATSRTNQIGSIGTRVIMNDTSELFKQQGIKPIVIDTGANKSTGAPGVPITEEQQEPIKETVKQLQTFFEESIIRARPNVDINKVNDGRTFLARDAKQRGLIDGIASERNTRKRLEAMIR